MWWPWQKKQPLKRNLNRLLFEAVSSMIAGIGGLLAAVYFWGQITAPGLLASPTVWEAGKSGIFVCGILGLVALLTGVYVLCYTLKLRELLHDQLAKEEEQAAQKGK